MINQQQQDIEKILHKCEQQLLEYKTIQNSSGDSYKLYRQNIDVGLYLVSPSADYNRMYRHVRIKIFPKSNSPSLLIHFMPQFPPDVQALGSGSLPLNSQSYYAFTQRAIPSDHADWGKAGGDVTGVTIYSNYDFTTEVTTVNQTYNW